MTKVITYGTFDLLHRGHIRLLERAKALGDYLVVGVTADDFDKARGKINVQQSLIERIEAIKATGIADEIIIEEYEGQKINDILLYDIDIFAIGTDWKGKFDYLGEFCKVVYLDRTEGVSSTEIREARRRISLGIVGDSPYLSKIIAESEYVDGIQLSGICVSDKKKIPAKAEELPLVTDSIEELLSCSDAVYLYSYPQKHFELIKTALEMDKHVLCESPICMTVSGWQELQDLAKQRGLVLADALRTAYSTAYYRLLLLVKGGKIGKVVSVDAACTSLRVTDAKSLKDSWNSITSWGPTALLPVFQLLGTNYQSSQIVSHYIDDNQNFDLFSKVSFVYPDAVASVMVGNGVKSEGHLIISGTKGYVYVPSPWWKTDYFEIRFENPAENRRYFYQIDGEGIRLELVSFVKSIQNGRSSPYIAPSVSKAICQIMENSTNAKHVIAI